MHDVVGGVVICGAHVSAVMEICVMIRTIYSVALFKKHLLHVLLLSISN